MLRQVQHPESLVLFNVGKGHAIRKSGIPIRLSTTKNPGSSFFIDVLQDAAKYGQDELLIPKRAVLISSKESSVLLCSAL